MGGRGVVEGVGNLPPHPLNPLVRVISQVVQSSVSLHVIFITLICSGFRNGVETAVTPSEIRPPDDPKGTPYGSVLRHPIVNDRS